MSRDAVQHEPIGGLAAESVLHVVRVRWVEHDVDWRVNGAACS